MRTTTCVQCGEPLPPAAGKGRARRYCSGRCRQAAVRDREALTDYIPEPLSPEPTSAMRAELVQIADAILTADRAAPPEEQLARGVIEARVLADSMRRLEPTLDRGLRWRAAELGRRIDRALLDLFPIGSLTTTTSKEHQ